MNDAVLHTIIIVSMHTPYVCHAHLSFYKTYLTYNELSTDVLLIALSGAILTSN